MWSDRRSRLGDEVKDMWHRDGCFATRGLYPLYELIDQLTPPSEQLTVFWELELANELTGLVYTDGSATRVRGLAAMDRAGWGAAVIQGETLCCGVWGNLPGFQQTVPRAELYAIMFVLERG